MLRRRLQWTALFTTGLLAVLAFEVGLRIVGYGDRVAHKPSRPGDEAGVWQGMPLFSDEVLPDSPAESVRNGRIDEPRPAGRYRIAFLGDSFTYGVSLRDSETLPARLEAELRRRGLDVDVANLGTQGTNTQQQAMIARLYLSRVKPDFVVLVVIGNDAEAQPWEPDPVETCGVPITFEERLDHFFLKHAYAYRPLHAAVVRDGCEAPQRCFDGDFGLDEDTPASRCFHRSLDEIAELAAAGHAGFAAMAYPRSIRGAFAGDGPIERALTARHIALLPVQEALRDIDTSDAFLGDGHPSAYGNERVALSLADWFAPRLAGAAAGKAIANPSAKLPPVSADWKPATAGSWRQRYEMDKQQIANSLHALTGHEPWALRWERRVALGIAATVPFAFSILLAWWLPAWRARRRSKRSTP